MTKRTLCGIAGCLYMMLAMTGCLSGLIPKFKPASDINKARLQRAVEYNPENVHAHFMIGRAALGENEPKLAGEHFRRATELSPDYFEAWGGLAISLMDQGKYGRAEEVYAEMAARFPASAETLAGRASAAYALEEMKDARLYAEQALELNGNSSSALRVLGEIAYAEGNYQEALGHWQRAMEINPGLKGEYQPVVLDLESYLENY